MLKRKNWVRLGVRRKLLYVDPPLHFVAGFDCSVYKFHKSQLYNCQYKHLNFGYDALDSNDRIQMGDGLIGLDLNSQRSFRAVSNG